MRLRIFEIIIQLQNNAICVVFVTHDREELDHITHPIHRALSYYQSIKCKCEENVAIQHEQHQHLFSMLNDR